MLKKNNNKEEKIDIDKGVVYQKDPKRQLLTIAVVLIVAFAFTFTLDIVMPNEAPLGEKLTNLEYLDKIGDNYTIEVTKRVDEISDMVTIEEGNGVKNYVSASFDKEGYMYYDNQYYFLEIDELKKIDTFNYEEIFNPIYFDFNLISNLISRSYKEELSSYESTYYLKLSDFLKEYNYYYDKNYKVTDEEDLEFTIDVISNENFIDSIVIDYTPIENFFNDTKLENFFYGIKIRSVNNNDFESRIDYIESLENSD